MPCCVGLPWCSAPDRPAVPGQRLLEVLEARAETVLTCYKSVRHMSTVITAWLSWPAGAAAAHCDLHPESQKAYKQDLEQRLGEVSQSAGSPTPLAAATAQKATRPLL